MARAYYAFVAGLPDLVLDSSRLSFSVDNFKEEARDYLEADDYERLSLFYLPVDNANLLRLLDDPQAELERAGRYSGEELVSEIKSPGMLPAYMQEFLEWYNEQTSAVAPHYREYLLTNYFLAAMQAHENDFVRSWFSFDMNLRNVLTALVARRQEISLDEEITGDNIVSEAIRKANSGDFGLGREFPWIEKLLALFDGRNLVERELGIDMLRWDFLEEATVFSYFSIEKVIAFYLKLTMAERWYALDEETGKELFEKLLQELRHNFVLPEEFSASGGK